MVFPRIYWFFIHVFNVHVIIGFIFTVFLNLFQHVMVNDFSVVIKVMNMLQDFMRDEEQSSLEVTSLPSKQQKMVS